MFFVKMKSLLGDNSDLSLAIRWEGFYHDMNYRDLGKSVNDCYGEKIFNENLISRSAGWFSGWSCGKIGNPDVLFSLNFSPKENKHFFCHSSDNKLIGKSFKQKIVLNDLEFIENWNNPEITETTCLYIDNIISEIILGKKVHFHCDAGRDRAGTISALIIGLTAEKKKILNQKMINAIECDYRKTKSLTSEKYGRMENFINQIRQNKSIEKFILEKCSISENKIELLTKKFLKFL
tara:strand:- start:1365 stop:2072 length:708 start_codon:yes stop_codon:yes gene_type:complete